MRLIAPSECDPHWSVLARLWSSRVARREYTDSDGWYPFVMAERRLPAAACKPGSVWRVAPHATAVPLGLRIAPCLEQPIRAARTGQDASALPPTEYAGVILGLACPRRRPRVRGSSVQQALELG